MEYLEILCGQLSLLLHKQKVIFMQINEKYSCNPAADTYLQYLLQRNLDK